MDKLQAELVARGRSFDLNRGCRCRSRLVVVLGACRAFRDADQGQVEGHLLGVNIVLDRGELEPLRFLARIVVVSARRVHEELVAIDLGASDAARCRLGAWARLNVAEEALDTLRG